MTVWTLVGYWREVPGKDIVRVSDDYDVPVEAVQAALAFYTRNRALIDGRLALNAV